MNLILFGGNSIINKQWLHDLAAVLKPHFSSTYIHHYRHWETGEELIDLDYELEVLTKNLPAEPYIVIAKSAGVLLTLKGIAEEVLKPQKCIFLGTPISWAKNNNFEVDTWLHKHIVPTLFVQQTYDPALPFKDLRHYLHKADIHNYQLLEVAGEDHMYDDIRQVKDIVMGFINEHGP